MAKWYCMYIPSSSCWIHTHNGSIVTLEPNIMLSTMWSILHTKRVIARVVLLFCLQHLKIDSQQSVWLTKYGRYPSSPLVCHSIWAHRVMYEPIEKSHTRSTIPKFSVHSVHTWCKWMLWAKWMVVVTQLTGTTSPQSTTSLVAALWSKVTNPITPCQR